MNHRMRLFIILLLTLFFAACRGMERSGGDPGELVTRNSSGTSATATDPAISGFSCQSVSEIPLAECQALLALYEATNGPSWSDDSGWLQTTTPCSWTGVACADGHVDTLTLLFNKLQGPLPSSLSDLAQLRLLDLHNNAISGSMPPELGGLSRLEALDISANQLEGPIPAAFGELSALQSLHLAHNQLSGEIPAELGQLPNLHTLDLGYNQLGGQIPPALGTLSTLESLHLNDNQLEGEIPASLGSAQTLVDVNLAFNQLTGAVPAGLEPSVTTALWGNRLQGTVDVRSGETVSAAGVHFTGDESLVATVWPELLPAVVPGPQSPWWDALPAHTRLTLVHADGALSHAPMGINVPGEAQIHIYPVAGLDEANREQVRTLERLLNQNSSRASSTDSLPLLPPTNAQQMFQAQTKTLDFANGSGIRYLTQYAQGLTPISNDQLFYTFQGLTADGFSYVAAFFPVNAPFLPATSTEAAALPEVVPFLQGADTTYFTETLQTLEEMEAESFAPPLSQIDDLIRSLSIGVAAPSPELAVLEGGWPENGESVDAEPLLQWSEFPGTANYELVVVDDDAYPPFVAFSQAGPATIAPITPPLEPGSYSWTVRALDDNGTVLAELNRQFLVKATIEAIAPAPGASVEATPTLVWKPYAGASGYQIVILDDDVYPPVVVTGETVNDTTFTVTTPLEAGNYSWTVWALGANQTVIAELNSQFLVEAASE